MSITTPNTNSAWKDIYTQSPIQAPKIIETSSSTVGDNKGDISCTLGISYESFYKSFYSELFRKSTQSNMKVTLENSVLLSGDEADFIAKCAQQYRNIYDEILKTTSNKEEQNKKVGYLDEVFSDAIDRDSERLADDFDYFFNMASKFLKHYNIQTNSEITLFDKNNFKQHLKTLGYAAKEFYKTNVSDGTDSIEFETYMDRAGSDDNHFCVENMSYSSIKNVSQILSSLKRVNFLDSYSNINEVLGSWENAAGKLKGIEGVSNKVKDLFSKAVEQNKAAAIQIGLYVGTVNSYNKQMDELFNEYSDLMKNSESMNQLNKIKEQIELLQKRRNALTHNSNSFQSFIRKERESSSTPIKLCI